MNNSVSSRLDPAGFSVPPGESCSQPVPTGLWKATVHPAKQENLAGFWASADWVDEPVLARSPHLPGSGQSGCLLEDRFTAGQKCRMCLRQGPKVFMQISQDAQPVWCEKVEKKCIVSNTTQKEKKTLHSNVQKVPIILQNKVLFLFLHQNQQKRFKQVRKTQFIWR